VNMAARLEQAGKRHPGGVLVDEAVARRAARSFTFREVGTDVLIAGLGPTRIFALEAAGAGIDPSFFPLTENPET
jgi:class 3 adenylate cyclase